MKYSTLKPFGVMVCPSQNEKSLLDIAKKSILQLLDNHSLVLFRGYDSLDNNHYINFAKQFGSLLSWEFGEILELKLQDNPANHIFSSGRVELHWDGAFVKEKPHYNLFQCLKGSHEESGGKTLFVNTLEVIRRTQPIVLKSWDQISITYSTEKKAHYGGTIHEPLCSNNPYNDKKVIRYIEAFNEDNETINPMKVEVKNFSPPQSNRFLINFTKRLYQDDVMYQHTWQDGDFLIADNSCLLHGRSRFNTAQLDRHIKRINIL